MATEAEIIASNVLASAIEYKRLYDTTKNNEYKVKEQRLRRIAENIKLIVGSNSSSAVSSFNGRTGAVILQGSDVTGALGYTPLSAEVDTLDSVTTRGNTTTNAITVSGLNLGTNVGVTSSNAFGLNYIEFNALTATQGISALFKPAAGSTGYAYDFEFRKDRTTYAGLLIIGGNASAGAGTANKNIIAVDNSGSRSDWLAFRVAATNSSWGGATDLLSLTHTQNVLIGTTTDAGYKLDVNGTVLIRDYTQIINSNSWTSAFDAFTLVLPNTPGSQNSGHAVKVRRNATVKLSDRYGDSLDVGLHVNYFRTSLNAYFGRSYSNLASTGLGVANNSTGTHDFAGSIGSGITTGGLVNNNAVGSGLCVIERYNSNNYTAATAAVTYGVYSISTTNNLTINGAYKRWVGGYFSAQPNYSTNNDNAVSIGVWGNAQGGQFNYAGLFTGGNVGIGITNPSYLLHVNGTVSALLTNATHSSAVYYNTTTGELTYGALPTFTETDPIFTASPSFGITSTNISNWNTAYGWGNHATVGYLTAESDTLDSVTGRGNTTTNAITVGGLTVDTNVLVVDPTNNKVGIGTTTPAYPLDVVGQIQASSDIFVGLYNKLAWGNNGYNYLKFSGGYLNMGYISDAFKFDMNSSTVKSIEMVADSNFQLVGKLNRHILLTPQGTGNVGIGTTTPTSKLEVKNGTVIISDTNTGSQINLGIGLITVGRPFIGTNTNTNNLEFGTRGNVYISIVTNSTEKIRITNTGNLLIGTTTDAGYKLDVNGDIRSARLYANVIRDSNGNNIVSTSVLNITNTDTTVGTGTTNTLTLSTKSLTGVVYVPNGNVGIGTSTPAYKLQVQGTVSAVLTNATHTSQVYYNTTTGELTFGPVPAVGGGGTVTSVAMTVPTGLTVSGSPITSAGTLALTFASGYSIPTTASQANWDTAFGWGNHATVGYLTAESDTLDSVTGRGNTTTNVIDIGGAISDYYRLDTAATPTPVQGMMFWDSDRSTVDVQLDVDVSAKIGQDNFWYVKNQSGATIPKGKAVMAVGTLGASGRILIDEMVANGSISSEFLLGVTAEDIANGADGFVMNIGKLRQVNTAIWPAGTVLYCDPTTPGNLTSTKPSSPNLALHIAYVVHSAANGVLAIRVSTLDENAFNTPTLAQVTTAGNTTTNAITVGGLIVDTNTLVVDSVNKRVGIGTLSPIAQLHVVGPVRIEGALQIVNLSDLDVGGRVYASLSTGTGNKMVFYNNASRQITYDDYVPAIYITNTQITNWDTAYSWGNHATAGYLTSQPWVISGSNIYYTTGNVGIGTTNPSYKLDVAGDIIARDTYPTIYVDHSGTVLGGIRADATTKLEFKTLTTAPLSFQVNNSQKMTIQNTGNVLIGTNTDAGHRVEVAGGVNSNSYYSLSGTLAATTNNYLYRVGTSLYWKRNRVRSYIERAITGVSTDPANYNKYYEIGSFAFVSLEGVFNIDISFNGSGYGQGSRHVVPVTYRMDYISRYTTGLGTVHGAGVWLVVDAISQTPRHLMPSANNWELQMNVIDNSVKFRIVIRGGGGTGVATAFVKISHNNDFDNSTYTELTGVGVDATVYPSLPAIISGINGKTHIQNNLTVIGNVGIGISNPAYKLEVNGSIGGSPVTIARFTAGAAAGGTRGLNMYSDGSQFKLQVSDNAGGIGTWAFLNLNPDGGNVGIGTTSPAYKLDVNGTARVSGNLTANAFIKTGGTSSQFLKADGSVDSNVYLTSFTETDPIFTASPSFGITSTNISNWNTAYGWGNHATVGYLTSQPWVISGSNIYYTTGNVGIATNNPKTRLHIGAEVIDDNNYSYDSNALMVVHQTPTSSTVLNDPKEVLILARQGTGNQAYGAAAAFDLSRYQSSSTNSRTRLDIRLANGAFLSSGQNTVVMTMLSSGNVGIGTTTPSAKLHVVGDIKATLANVTTANVVYYDTTTGLLTYGAAPGGGGGGTVTSVAMSVPTGLTVTGSPITTSGTLAVTFAAGYSIPTTANQTNWTTAYTNRIATFTTTGSSGAATFTGNTLNIPNYTLAGLGYTTPTLAQVTTAGNTTTNSITINSLTINNGTFNASVGFGLINNPTGNFFDVLYANTTGLRFGNTSFDGSAFQAFGGLHASFAGQMYFDYGSQQRVIANRSANFRNASSTSPVTVMKMTDTSNVLIGTTTDAGYKLYVAGTTRNTQTRIDITPTVSTLALDVRGTGTPNDYFTLSNATGGANDVFLPIFFYKAATYGYNGGTNRYPSGVYGGGFIAAVTDTSYPSAIGAGAAMHFNARTYANNGPLNNRYLFSWGSWLTTHMAMTAGGNLLIGTTTNSGYKLDVNGNARISGTIEDTGGNSSEWNLAYLWGDHSLAGYLTGTTGYTGIFTIPTNPPGQQNLDIQNGLIINVF